jgi:S1-C subfamily serine protease
MHAIVRGPAHLVLLFAAAVCSGCNKEESLPDTPPPEQPPPVAADASLRPHYLLGGRSSAAGTAFVVRGKSGQLYMLTAAHVMDNDAEWQQVRAVALHQMGGGEVAQVAGRPVFIGKPLDVGGVPSDLVIWPLANGAKATPLKLAADDPKKNEWVWAIGQEVGSSGPQKLYRCKVTGSDSGGFTLRQHDTFEMHGFSGGPVVNSKGEVVGSVLAGKSPDMMMSAVSSIRQRLKEAGVEVE